MGALQGHVALDDINRKGLFPPFGFHSDGSKYGVVHPSQIPLAKGAELLLDWPRDRSRNLERSFG